MSQQQSIGILVAGSPPGHLKTFFGPYDRMVRRMLGHRFAYRSFDVARGELPGKVEACDAYVITGSTAGVYDAHPWISPLEAFLCASKGHSKLIGICFGHQLMAQAFGGAVDKSPHGWSIGLEHYEVRETAPWMDGARAIAVPVSHQDQVVSLPPGAQVLAGSATTRHGVLAYEDGRSISLQCHPEFEPTYAAQLAESDVGHMSRIQVERAVASLSQPNDCTRVGKWIAAFLQPDVLSAPAAMVDCDASQCTMPGKAGAYGDVGNGGG